MECQDLKCCVCCQEYEERSPPRNLGCGHSVCTPCLEQVIKLSKRCPECRYFFREDFASDLPINYPLLNFSRVFTQRTPDSDAPTRPKLTFNYPRPNSSRPMHAGRCALHGINMFFMCMSCDVWICRECFDDDHQDPPYGRCFILSADEAVRKIKKSHTTCLSRDIELAKDLKQHASKEHDLLDKVVKYLSKTMESDSKFENLLLVQTDLEKHFEILVGYLSKLLNNLKCLEKAKEFLENHLDIEDNMSYAVTKSTDSHVAFEKLISSKEDKPTVCANRIILGALQNDMIKLTSSGKSVSVVPVDEEKSRWAPLVLHENRLHLYSLRDGSPPETSLILPYELVRALVPNESPLVFMDIGWAEDLKGVVCVRMFGCTPRSLQTVFLCSGEKGPSYRNTCFYQSSIEDGGALIISGGDYENNNGTGGRAFVEDITSGGVYCHDVEAGLFVSWPAHEHWRLGSFEIYLSDDHFAVDHSAHGKVEEGLDILIQTAGINPITSTSVMDCGLIIPL